VALQHGKSQHNDMNWPNEHMKNILKLASTGSSKKSKESISHISGGIRLVATRGNHFPVLHNHTPNMSEENSKDITRQLAKKKNK
jgi:hypothetical protein